MEQHDGCTCGCRITEADCQSNQVQIKSLLLIKHHIPHLECHDNLVQLQLTQSVFFAVLQPEPVPVRVCGPSGEGGVPAGGAAQDVGRGQLPLPVRRELQRVLHRTLLRQHRQMQVKERERLRDVLIIGQFWTTENAWLLLQDLQ